jgi:hypothetical protein
MTTRGIREVPNNLDTDLFNFLTDIRAQVVALTGNQAPLSPPTNLKATAQSFAITIQFTRTDADYFEILWSMAPTLNNAAVVDIGNSNQWTDNVGQAAITKYYWVRARRNTGAVSAAAGPVKATTLASGTGATPASATSPPPSSILVVDKTTGQVTSYVPSPNAGVARLR